MPCKHSQKRLPTNGYPNLQRKKRHAKIYNHQNSLRMEERKLDTRESMELISRMIQNTRNRLENHAGRPFLVWGYTTVGIALLNYWFNIAGCHPAWCFTWFLIPIIGCLLMRLFRPHRRQGLVSILIIIDSDLPLFAISRTLLPTQSFRTHYTGDGYGNGNNRNDRSFENIHRRRTYLYGSFSPLPFIRLFPEKNRNF